MAPEKDTTPSKGYNATSFFGHGLQFIFLEAHDNASFFDHELQSDTFKSRIEARLTDYVTKKD
jgi:hypothetical protein